MITIIDSLLRAAFNVVSVVWFANVGAILGAIIVAAIGMPNVAGLIIGATVGAGLGLRLITTSFH